MLSIRSPVRIWSGTGSLATGHADAGELRPLVSEQGVAKRISGRSPRGVPVTRRDRLGQEWARWLVECGDASVIPAI